MEHFIRTAFWIVALAACLQGKPVTFVEITDWNIEGLKKVECSDSTMYSPKDVKNECFISALECITAELEGRAKVECSDGEEIQRGLDTLNHVISDMEKKRNQMVNSSECDCHKWPEQPFHTFVDNVTSLLQKINANF